MQFNISNKIIKLCSEGMELEGQGRKKDALKLFQQAWNEASDDFEKFTSANYIARHQANIQDKLMWDETALNFALKTNDEKIKGTYPSSYLNIGKCYEDLGDFYNAGKNYELALSFTDFLADDGYGKMIKSGIMNGIERNSM